MAFVCGESGSHLRDPRETIGVHDASAFATESSESAAKGGAGILVVDGIPFKTSLSRRQLLATLSGCPYTATRTLCGRTRLHAAEKNCERLLTNAFLFPWSNDFDVDEEGPLSAEGAIPEALVLKSLLELDKFSKVIIGDIRLSVESLDGREGSMENAIPISPFAFTEAAVTVLLFRHCLLERVKRVLEVKDLNANFSPRFLLSRLTANSSGASFSTVEFVLHLAILSEPLLPSRAILKSIAPSDELRRHLRGALVKEAWRSFAEPEGHERQLRKSRCCFVYVRPHSGRELPEVKNSTWERERESLWRDVAEVSASLNLPIEEALLEGKDGLLEGSSSNFLVFSRTLKGILTAPSSLCLPGLALQVAKAVFRSRGIAVYERPPQWELKESEEWSACWIASASRLLLPVRGIIRRHTANGSVSSESEKENLEVLLFDVGPDSLAAAASQWAEEEAIRQALVL